MRGGRGTCKTRGIRERYLSPLRYLELSWHFTAAPSGDNKTNISRKFPFKIEGNQIRALINLGGKLNREIECKRDSQLFLATRENRVGELLFKKFRCSWERQF